MQTSPCGDPITPGRVATTVTMFESPVRLDPEIAPQGKRESNPGLAFPEADALPLGQRGGLQVGGLIGGHTELTILSPELTILTPELTILSPELTILTPELTILTPELTILTPELTILTPEVTTLSPENASLA